MFELTFIAMNPGGRGQEPNKEIKPRDNELVNFQGADEAGAIWTWKVLLVNFRPIGNIKPSMPILHPK